MMVIQDHIGRIDRTPFVVSTGFFLGLALSTVIFRFVIRFAVQKQQFQIDDALIILATILNLAASIILYDRGVERMYLFAALQHDVQGVQAPEDILLLADPYHKWVTTSLMIGWISISTVKFFFLLFFFKLIDRLREWRIYWWIAFFINVFVAVFGISIYYISCPYGGGKALYCPSGTFMSARIRYSAAQISLDILGDLLILVISIGILWSIRINMVQKLALSSSLCLTILLIAFSITRVAGLVWKGQVDGIWEVYWIIMSANMGVFLAAASAFRTFFVAHKNSKSFPCPPLHAPRNDGTTPRQLTSITRSKSKRFNPTEDNGSELATIIHPDEQIQQR